MEKSPANNRINMVCLKLKFLVRSVPLKWV